VREQAVKTTSQNFGANSFIVSQVASSGNLSRKELSDKLRKNPEIYRREAEAVTSRINEVAIAATGPNTGTKTSKTAIAFV
jgi:hypothetical protein